MTETSCSKFKINAVALAIASCLSAAPWYAEAAGLGKLTVFSALGQPLRAELEIAASREEVVGMTARLASADAFSQAGIDYSSSLRDLRFAVDKRSNGQAVVKVTSAKPVNDPFLDFLVELNWPAGRLVREYTFLLDPPEFAPKGSASPAISVAEARVVETVAGGNNDLARPAASARGPAAAPVRPAPVAKAESPAKADKEVAKSDRAASHLVKSGETLRQIATETRYNGVSLDQMLVGLYQNNPDAFIGQNVNRLKAGAILNVPEKSVVEAVTSDDAKKIYVTQTGDWNAYRQKLASTTAKATPRAEAAAAQTSSGKIAPKVEEKSAPAEQSKDQVKVSRTEASAKSAGALATEADRIAKEKALKDAQDRTASLEKNVNDLQKLLDVKTQKLSELQQQAVPKKEEAKPVEAVKPAEPAKEVAPPKVVEAPAKPAESVAPVEVPKPVEPAKPVEVPKPVEPAMPAPAAEPEVEAPGFVDALMANPLGLLGGGGLLALLAGYFVVKRRRQQDSSLETMTAPTPSALGANSVFRMTGGQSVDTSSQMAPMTGDFSQTGPGNIDTDEVDPVAEADVYMAYGRDTQAEEILLEALQKDPQRTSIHSKLLEIYAGRKSLKQFETLAGELYAQTGGVGQDWEKVSQLGAGLDPANPLYSAGQAAPVEAFDSAATMLIAPEALTPVAAEPVVEAVPEAAEEEDTPVVALDLDAAEPAPVVAEEVPVADAAAEDMALDFQFDEPVAEPVAEPEVSAMPEVAPQVVAAEVLAPIAPEPYVETVVSGNANALDFEFATAEPAVHESAVGELVVSDDAEMDVVDFDFDLAAAPLATEADFSVAETAQSHDFSPEGTLVMPSGLVDTAVTGYAGAEVSSLSFDDLPVEPQAVSPPAFSPAVDFDIDASSTVVTSMPHAVNSEFSADPLGDELDNPHLSETMIVQPGSMDADSLEFDVKLTDSVFLGQPMMPTEFDIGSINLDLAAEPLPEPPLAAAPSAPEEMPDFAPALDAPVALADAEIDDPTQDAVWEQVNTKLDLAKAYEEMGDLEGARELLQEVVGEGSDDLVVQAREILGRIGE